jgi:hypothetical protein
VAKKVIPQTASTDTAEAAGPNDGSPLVNESPRLDYDLVGDIVFDPPLTPEEQRRIVGLGMSMEERLEQARRRLAEGEEGF